MRYPKLRELKEAVKALIRGPYTSRFPFKPHTPFERFRGRPKFDQDYCIGCGACAQVCPAKAIDCRDILREGEAKRILTVHWDICIFCGQCQANCPVEKGIVLSREYAFATCSGREELSQTIEKDLVTCSACNETVVTKDQYVWVAGRLGPLLFSNASLLLFYLSSSGLCAKDISLPVKDRPFQRSDRIKVLCPRCRREAAIKS